MAVSRLELLKRMGLTSAAVLALPDLIEARARTLTAAEFATLEAICAVQKARSAAP